LISPDTALVDSLYEETMLLNRLVADLHELAQAEAGQLTLVRMPTALPDVAERAVQILRPQADTKGVTLSVDLARDLPEVDIEERIGQVLRNLMNNALAHTPEGGEIGLSAVRDGDLVSVAVRDTGEGILPEHLPHVFDRFYRADRSRARQTGGYGLGLAIVKQLVLAHGGTITVESESGSAAHSGSRYQSLRAETIGEAIGGQCHFRSIALHQLDEHTVCTLWMNKRNTAISALFRCLIDELSTLRFQVGQRRLDVVHFKTNVVQPLTALSQVLGDARIRVDRFQELNLAIARGKNAISSCSGISHQSR
jgi:anti-sigma regulatory factor (Ser/Thr protein kinase)